MNKNLVVTAAVSAVVSATVALTLGGGAALAALHYYGNQTIVQGSGSVSCPVDYVLTGGGFGKISKLGQGALDLHSGRSQVDLDWLAAECPELPRAKVLAANTAQEVLEMASGIDLAQRVARAGLATVREVLKDAPVTADVIIVSRQGEIIAHAV
jgi:cobalamin biosynthesis protein CbiD